MNVVEVNLTEDEWVTAFKPKVVPNNVDSGGFGYGRGDTLFETYGESLKIVQDAPPRHVWTLLDGDDGNLCIVSGMHFVNRIGYFITEASCDEDKFYTIEVNDE